MLLGICWAEVLALPLHAVHLALILLDQRRLPILCGPESDLTRSS